MATTTVKVNGMTCGACTSAVERAFQNVLGVGDVSVSLTLGRAVVQHDPQLLTLQDIVERIEDRGFDVEILKTEEHSPVNEKESHSQDTVVRTTLSVKGMTCGACTSAVESGLQETDGVKSVSVSLLSERAVVEYDPRKVNAEVLAEKVEDRGFDACVVETKSSDDIKESQQHHATIASGLTSTTIAIQGMTCGACTSAVEKAMQGSLGVSRVDVSLLAERAVIVHDDKIITAEQIGEIIEDTGFDACVVSSFPELGHHSRRSHTITFNLYGLKDATHAEQLENALVALAGVSSAKVQMATSRVSITYEPPKIGPRAIAEMMEKMDINCILGSADENNAQLESLAKTKEIREWRRAFLISLGLAIPIMFIGMIIPMYFRAINFGAYQIIPGLFLKDVVCCLLTIPVQFGVGKRFYVSGYRSLKHGSPTMDVLVLLGTSTAFIFSCLAVIVSVVFPPHSQPGTVFETSSMLITFITLGRWLENRAKGQTSRALSRLMSLAPPMATIYVDPIAAEKAAEEQCSSQVDRPSEGQTAQGNGLKSVPTELVQVSDMVCLRPGDKIPADGVVIRGESYVDESMVTGEAIPVQKLKGHPVMAGTVNGAGWVDFKVTRAGEDTQLSQIVNLVQNAQTNRAPIQRTADVVAGYFVPAIILLALATFFVWMIVSHLLSKPPKVFLSEESGGRIMVCLKICISVVVFACPCALGLSTPTAVMVGTGVGAEQGILFKGGAALEAATKITHVVFDKTGTLTEGKMSVSEIEIGKEWSASNHLRKLWWLMVGLAEKNSEHPVGKAIGKASAEQSGLGDETLDGVVLEFETALGKGVSALVRANAEPSGAERSVLVGNAQFLKSRNIDVDNHEPDHSRSSISSAKARSIAGQTYIYVAIDGEYAGSLKVQDSIKPTAAAAVAALHRMGLSTSLVTGDTLTSALGIARAVGIPESNVRASVKPSDKQKIVTALQDRNSWTKVAMVGDGINDSPALATATVGIALASGTDVAVEAADIVLMRPEDLLSVPTSFCLARSILNRIRLNLLWACLYNAIGLPFAMGLFLPFSGIMLHPMASGAAMAASSTSVVVSSLLLKFWKRPAWLDGQKLEQEVRSGKIDGELVNYNSSSLMGSGWIGCMYHNLIRPVGKALGITKASEGDQGYLPLQTLDSPV
ncbi:hypothetical protein KEM54_000612 [Ascosphaera aggregata]|nr:hypothetical protein KEM54_000612 [Ascosphaera aggregata]